MLILKIGIMVINSIINIFIIGRIVNVIDIV